ncbi:hypothetical protein H0A36_25085 [Endozoicomonas sp. SM1973]|uniref:Uncharacterized protein n=1 Tax=Spartinivicinus marinus TaxID=2994442 RepID=A0A853IFI4_9GAMM|nr:hypothetical protein [Spartinivicinus marinus]MCX4028053.1 hypothetical protein [Spartinivicinus marinus]NYZ69298.1 hypothetical protein [Spartinivicinus marinus]
MKNVIVYFGFIAMTVISSIPTQAFDISVDSEEIASDSKITEEEQVLSPLPQLFQSEQERLAKKQAHINEMIEDSSILRKALQDDAASYKYHWEKEDHRRLEKEVSGEGFKKRP